MANQYLNSHCPSCGCLKDSRAIECKKCFHKNRPPQRGKGKYGIGRSMTAAGYIYLHTEKKYEHRAVMEAHLGRKLTRKEHVHHKNGVKTDNRIENLEIMGDSEHHKEHMTSDVAKNRSILGHKARWGYDATVI